MKNIPEEWRDILGFEGSYQVSSHGRIRNSSGQILKPYENKKGYLKIGLCKNGKNHKKRINRLVAMAFIENPNGLPQVDHLNGNKQDNRVTNLQWADNSTNSGLKKIRREMMKNIPVVMAMIGKTGIENWSSMTDGEKIALLMTEMLR